MGLFSSKKKTYVGTQVMRAIEDKSLPNAVQQGTIQAIIEDGQVSDYILENGIQSIAVKADNMYRYAEKTYAFGSPSGESYSNTQGRSQVQAILDTLEGSPVVMEYFRYGPPNLLHFGWQRLIAWHGYDPDTNKLENLTVEMGKSVYLKDVVVVVPFGLKDTYEKGALSQWGTAATAGYTPERPASITIAVGNLAEHTPIRYSKLVSSEQVVVSYVVDSPTTDSQYVDGSWTTEITYPTGEFTIQMGDLDEEADFFQAKYWVNDQTKYWSYKANTGTYSALDSLFESPAMVNGSFFPIAYFRHNKARVDQNKDSSEYKTSVKLTKYIGIDYQTIVDAVHESPDIGDVEQAMLLMAVPANTVNPVERKYLFDFFNAQYYSQESLPKRANLSGGYFFDLVRGGSENSILIQDKRSKFVLKNRGIFKLRKVGRIGNVGEFHSSYGEVTFESKYEEEDGDVVVRRAVGLLFGSVPVHYYRKQIANNIYEEISVIDLQMLYNVWGRYNTVADETDNILLIPIDRSITKDYWIGDRETLYARSLHYIFNSRVVVKVKWYQQGWFADLIKIVGVVITIYSIATGNIITAFVATLVTNVALQIVVVILLHLLASLVITQALKIFVDIVGQDIAFLAAIVAAAYGIDGVIEAGGLQAAAPMAQNMLSLANGLVSAVGADIQGELQDLMGQFSDFDKYVEEQTKLLDKAEDLLKTSQVLSPFTIFGESPDDYYKRTVHSGNIGTITTDAVSNYVERFLTLPQLSHTLGEYEYG